MGKNKSDQLIIPIYINEKIVLDIAYCSEERTREEMMAYVASVECFKRRFFHDIFSCFLALILTLYSLKIGKSIITKCSGYHGIGIKYHKFALKKLY